MADQQSEPLHQWKQIEDNELGMVFVPKTPEG